MNKLIRAFAAAASLLGAGAPAVAQYYVPEQYTIEPRFGGPGIGLALDMMFKPQASEPLHARLNLECIQGRQLKVFIQTLERLPLGAGTRLTSVFRLGGAGGSDERPSAWLVNQVVGDGIRAELRMVAGAESLVADLIAAVRNGRSTLLEMNLNANSGGYTIAASVEPAATNVMAIYNACGAALEAGTLNTATPMRSGSWSFRPAITADSDSARCAGTIVVKLTLDGQELTGTTSTGNSFRATVGGDGSFQTTYVARQGGFEMAVEGNVGRVPRIIQFARTNIRCRWIAEF